MPNETILPKVSVVVCVHNEEENISKLIESLLSQQYANYEIILVNDRSYDATNQIINKYSSPKISTITVSKTPIGWDHKKYALTQGVKKAEGSYLLLTDGDCLPKDIHWIMNMVKHTSNKNIVLGTSFYQQEKSLLNSFIQFETYYTAYQFLSLTHQGLPYMGLGRNILYRKSTFIKKNNLKKYKNHAGGDDDILIQPMLTKGSTTYSLDTFTLSTPKNTWKAYINQKLRHLKSGARYPKKIKIVLFWLLFTHCMVYYTSILGLFSIHFRAAIIFGLSIRLIFIIIKYKSLTTKVKFPIRKRDIIFGDALFPVYFPLVGFFSIVLKTVRWK